MKITADTDLLVGEYVLGTLEREERSKLEEIAAREPTVAAAIMVWERRLAPLHELIVPVEPPATLWAEIAARVADIQPVERRRDPGFIEVMTALAESHRGDSAMRLVHKLRRWRAVALLFGVLFAASAAFFGAQVLKAKSEPPSPLVAVLRSDALTPPFVVAVDPATRVLNVRSVPAINPDDRAYAFWLLRRDQEPVPLGRLRGAGTLRLDSELGIERADLKEAAIGVSIEPNGAPRERPTTPMSYRGGFE
jgi:anti-sigma-K factor RskA